MFAERGKVLSIKLFSRFYAEVLYRHFDADNNGGLSANEAKAALKFLTKPGAPEAAIALPSPRGLDVSGGEGVVAPTVAFRILRHHIASGDPSTLPPLCLRTRQVCLAWRSTSFPSTGSWCSSRLWIDSRNSA